MKINQKPVELLESDFERRLKRSNSIQTTIVEYCENVPKWIDCPILDPQKLSTNYPPSGGIPALLNAISEQQACRGAAKLGASNILVTNGALHGLGLAFRHFGGPVACQTPLFSGIYRQLRLMDLSPILLPNWTDGASGLSGLLKDGVPAKTIYINTPNNPTGKCLDFEEQHLLIDYCKRTDRNLIIDLVYDAYTYSSPSFCLPILDEHPNIVAINSFSKNYGAPDIRVGWIASHQANIRRLTAALEADCIAVSGHAQAHALTLLGHGNDYLIQSVSSSKTLLSRLIGDAPPGHLVRPEAGTMFYLEVNFSDVGEFADYLLDHCGLLVSTSENYVACGRSHIRLPLGYPDDVVNRAVPLLLHCLTEWRM